MTKVQRLPSHRQQAAGAYHRQQVSCLIEPDDDKENLALPPATALRQQPVSHHNRPTLALPLPISLQRPRPQDAQQQKLAEESYPRASRPAGLVHDSTAEAPLGSEALRHLPAEPQQQPGGLGDLPAGVWSEPEEEEGSGPSAEGEGEDGGMLSSWEAVEDEDGPQTEEGAERRSNAVPAATLKISPPSAAAQAAVGREPAKASASPPPCWADSAPPLGGAVAAAAGRGFRHIMQQQSVAPRPLALVATSAVSGALPVPANSGRSSAFAMNQTEGRDDPVGDTAAAVARSSKSAACQLRGVGAEARPQPIASRSADVGPSAYGRPGPDGFAAGLPLQQHQAAPPRYAPRPVPAAPHSAGSRYFPHGPNHHHGQLQEQSLQQQREQQQWQQDQRQQVFPPPRPVQQQQYQGCPPPSQVHQRFDQAPPPPRQSHPPYEGQAAMWNGGPAANMAANAAGEQPWMMPCGAQGGGSKGWVDAPVGRGSASVDHRGIDAQRCPPQAGPNYSGAQLPPDAVHWEHGRDALAVGNERPPWSARADSAPPAPPSSATAASKQKRPAADAARKPPDDSAAALVVAVGGKRKAAAQIGRGKWQQGKEQQKAVGPRDAFGGGGTWEAL